MRYLSAILLISFLFAACAYAAEEGPAWAIMSTEVDEFPDGSGYMQRHALSLSWPTYRWADGGYIFFDPSLHIFDPDFPDGIDPGLDAYHYIEVDFNGVIGGLNGTGLHFFSSEVDFRHNDQYFQNEDLLVYDENLDILSEVFDVKDILGADYGLDGVSFLGLDELGQQEYWAFSTEVDGTGFTHGDILITDGEDLLSVIPLTFLFGEEVGLDAIHYMGEGYNHSWADTMWAISTEVDGSIIIDGRDGPVLPDVEIFFRDEDVLILEFVGNELGSAEVPWTGLYGFDRDVGLDALCIAPYNIPEPAVMVMMGLGLSMFLVRIRKK